MNWKGTAALGIILIVALGFYYLHSPSAGSTGGYGSGQRQNKLFPELVVNSLERIEILRKGETATTIDRATDSVGEYWRIAPPVDKPAEITVVQQMLFNVDRFVTSGGMEAGSAGTAVSVTGLDDPRLIVTFHGPRGQKGCIRFGNQPPTNTSAVFFQKEGDAKIYLATQEVFDAYDKPATVIRQKQLARYSPHQAVKVEFAQKIVRVRQGPPATTTVETEVSTMERLQEGVARGWWLTSPHREKVDDLSVMNLVTELSSFPILDSRPAGNIKGQGLEEPEERISIWLYGREAPVVIRFGDLAEGKLKRYAHVEGSGEVARVDEAKHAMLFQHGRNGFRVRTIFPFSRDSVKSFRLEVRGLGRIAIERRETRNAETHLVTSSWELLEPRPLKVDRDKMEQFVGSIVALNIDEFLGDQDLKMVKLDPAELTLSIETRDGKSHVCHFTDQFMCREGLKEVFSVEPNMVGIMKNMELNFMHPEIFNVPRESLQEFTFESRPGSLLKPIYYTIRFNPISGKWNYVKPDSAKGQEPVGDTLSGVTALMNFVQAESFISRDPATAAKHKLDEQNAPAKLTVRTQDGKSAVFYISEDKSDKPTRHIYYARLDPSPIVFQISELFVESLRQLGSF
jgi:hypothetical protein